MNNNRRYDNGYSGRSGNTGNTGNAGYRNNTGYARNYPQDDGYTRDYPQDDGYTRDYPQDDGYARNYPQDDGYARNYPQDDGYTRDYPQDDGYARNYPERRRSAGGVLRASYEPPEGNNSNLPLYLLAGLAVVILVVVLIAVSLAMAGKGGKNKNSDNAYTGVSDTDKGQATIIGFDDTDDEEESDETSSSVVYKNFVGTWKKTDVYESRKATVTVNAQYDDSFDFTLKMWSGDKTAVITGTAFFTGESTAVFKQSAASITLEQGSQYLSIYHSGKNKAFGIADGFEIDGKFTQGTPKYVKEENVGYDYNIYQSEAVVKALTSTLSSEDYALYQEMMTKGLKSPIPYERTLDKNGKKVNVDAELNAVKYYAHLSGIAADMIFICSNDAKIYVLFYDTEEMKYYTNDSNYASQMPASFRAVEKANNQKAIFK